MRKFLTSVAIVFALTGTACAQDFQKGLAAYAAGDYVTAHREWKPLAEQGDVGVQYLLGEFYFDGLGVPQDYKEAAKWYRKSAEQGLAEAQFTLGAMLLEGIGVPQDYKGAAKWNLKAAQQGLAASQYSLGLMYSYGLGVLQDNSLAHMWYNIASANGDELGGEYRDKLAKRMTREAIEKAQAMARECMSSNYQTCGD